MRDARRGASRSGGARQRTPRSTAPVGRMKLAELVRGWQAENLDADAIAERFLALLSGDATWTKAYGHPLRGEILGLLQRRGTSSPSHAADELEASLGTLAYHFRLLGELGLIEVDHEVPRRGAVEHVYRLTEGA